MPIDEKSLSENLQRAILIVEEKAARSGMLKHGEQEHEHWEVVIIAAAVNREKNSAHLMAASNCDTDASCYIAIRFINMVQNKSGETVENKAKVI